MHPLERGSLFAIDVDGSLTFDTLFLFLFSDFWLSRFILFIHHLSLIGVGADDRGLSSGTRSGHAVERLNEGEEFVCP
jgi:hypothetical protein